MARRPQWRRSLRQRPVRLLLRRLSPSAHHRRPPSGTRRPAPVTLLANPTGDLRWATAEVEVLHRDPYPDAAVFGWADGARGAGTPDDIIDALAPSAVVHLACHAGTGATLDDSYLQLAGAGMPVTRILEAARQRPGGAPGGLVVLSTCVSDLTGTAYDEALTLATAFLAAGAGSVVGARWAVNDRTTACLMVMFHRFRSTGLRDRDALRAAQRWMLDPERDVPPDVEPLCPPDRSALAEPVAWAPFAHHGR